MIELGRTTGNCHGGGDAFWDRCMTCDRLLRGQSPCWSWSGDPRVHLCETCAEPYVALEALRK